MPAQSKRELIVSVALELFYQNGVNATGVDLIISEAGVSKKTLYKHFRSKDELVLATLRKRDELFRNNLMRETERIAKTPKARLLAIFDVIAAWFEEKEFSGCMFINVAAEYSGSDNPCRILCAEHKRLICEYIRGLSEQAGVKNPEEFAKQLNVLIEGAIVGVHVGADHQSAKRAKEMAGVFLNLALD